VGGFSGGWKDAAMTAWRPAPPTPVWRGGRGVGVSVVIFILRNWRIGGYIGNGWYFVNPKKFILIQNNPKEAAGIP
jgi:hypothetical protein